MNNWEEKTNNEIMAAHIQMNEEYESKKTEIAKLGTRIEKLMKQLDQMDKDYLDSKKVLDARLNYSR